MIVDVKGTLWNTSLNYLAFELCQSGSDLNYFGQVLRILRCKIENPPETPVSIFYEGEVCVNVVGNIHEITNLIYLADKHLARRLSEHLVEHSLDEEVRIICPAVGVRRSGNYRGEIEGLVQIQKVLSGCMF
jgi:hypothetical protein